MAKQNVCTCGCTEAHEVARRQTADGVTVAFWSDGCVSGIMGLNVQAWPPRSAFATRRAIEANRIVADEVCLYDWSEVRSLIRTARRSLEQVCLAPADYIRRSMAGETFRSTGAVVTSRKSAPDGAETRATGSR